MNENEKIDDLVAMLDNLMEGGQGHVNVFCDGADGDVVAEATVSQDCGCGNKTACQIPTMFFEEENDGEKSEQE
ncbi:MAG: hypothetical protein R3Y65_08105 [Bacillota bacterium]